VEKLALKGASTIPVEKGGVATQEFRPDGLEEDPRWQLTQRVIAGKHFVRSPLLSKFLLYVVAETLDGRASEITEHQIGVQVFGRSHDYRTVEDNIVRNYARQLRKRLAEHFAHDGDGRSLRIEIPLGGYVPVFTTVEDKGSDLQMRPGLQPLLLEVQDASAPPGHLHPISASPRKSRLLLLSAAILAVYSVVVILLTWRIATGALTVRPVDEPAQILWKAMLRGPNNTYIVPPDAGLNLLEDFSRHPVPLADYIKGDYLEQPIPRIDAHSYADLRTQELTTFANLQIVSVLTRLQEYDPQRVFLRFPRDLRFDDLKDANAIIIGSVCSNPWASIANSGINFRIACSEDMQSSEIVNVKQQPGEKPLYQSDWNEPAHATYALIAFVPNLSGHGHLLLLQGLDIAGTQAAAEAVLHSDAIQPVLDRARLADGSLRPFEVLLVSTSIQSNAAYTQVIASRIH
jgi:hypothetical protein